MVPRLLVPRPCLGLEAGRAAVDVGGGHFVRGMGMVGQQLRAAMHAITGPAADYAQCATVQLPSLAAQQGFIFTHSCGRPATV